MSSFLWPDSTTRRLYNQGLTREQFERKQARVEANRKAKEAKHEPSFINNVKTFIKGTFNNVKKFFSRRKH